MLLVEKSVARRYPSSSSLLRTPKFASSLNIFDMLFSVVDNSVITKKGQVGIIDKSFMTKGEEGKRIAKIRK